MKGRKRPRLPQKFADLQLLYLLLGIVVLLAMSSPLFSTIITSY